MTSSGGLLGISWGPLGVDARAFLESSRVHLFRVYILPFWVSPGGLLGGSRALFGMLFDSARAW